MGRKLSQEEINGRTGADKLFPGKLHDMIDYAEQEGMDHIVSWTSDGKAFAIYKPKELIQLLPMFFGHAKYRSFHRQLNMWAYRRLVDGPNKGAFMHPYFIKGQKEKCKTISRHKFRTLPKESSEQESRASRQSTPSLFKPSLLLKGSSKDRTSPSQIMQEAMNIMQRSPSQVSVDSNEANVVLSSPPPLLPQVSQDALFQLQHEDSIDYLPAVSRQQCHGRRQSRLEDGAALTFEGKVFHYVGFGGDLF